MEATRVHATEQPLLKRTSAVFRVAFEGATPARTALVQSISSKEKGRVVVTHVFPQTGQQTALVHAHIYKDEKVPQAVERANLLAKQQPKAAAEGE